jgi:Gram-negative bacterial TonB protein C-terminal
MRASRYLTVLGLAMAAIGCRSSQKIVIPDEGSARPALSTWVGQNLVLRHFGERSEIVLKPGEDTKGTCDVAVHVTAADPVPSGVRFALDSVGRLRIADGSTVGTCKTLVPRHSLTLKPADAVHSGVWTPYLQRILMTPEAYLTANGHAFDLPPSKEVPKVVADPSIMADQEARKLARSVTAWPRPLFAVEPAFAAANKNARYEGEVTFEAIVGTDGRLTQAKVKTSLNADQAERVANALALWRFEPAHDAEHKLAAHYEGRTVLRIY